MPLLAASSKDLLIPFGRWLRDFLLYREARVQINGKGGDLILLSQGLPQGAFPSPSSYASTICTPLCQKWQRWHCFRSPIARHGVRFKWFKRVRKKKMSTRKSILKKHNHIIQKCHFGLFCRLTAMHRERDGTASNRTHIFRYGHEV